MIVDIKQVHRGFESCGKVLFNPSLAVTAYTRVEASFKPNKMPLRLIE